MAGKRNRMRTALVTITAAMAAMTVLGATQSSVALANTLAIPPSIPADCSRDVTTDLNAWIASVADNSTLTFTQDGCYRVDGTIMIWNRTGLTFEGNHSTFRAYTDGSELVQTQAVRTRNMWSFLRSAQITVSNVISIGANPNAGTGEAAYVPKFEAQHAYLIQNTVDMTMDHVEAYDVYGDFVYVGPNTQRLTVRNSTFARNGRQGWTINGTDIVFEHNSITGVRRSTVDMEPTFPTWKSQNIWIRDNDVGPHRFLFFSNGGAAAPTDNVNILNNRFHRSIMSMSVQPPAGTRSNYHIIGNVSDGVVSGTGAAMVFRQVVGLEVRGNTQPVQWSHALDGVGARACTHIIVADNVFRAADAVLHDRGENLDVSQSGNQIGTPPTNVDATHADGPTATVDGGTHVGILPTP